MKTLKYLGVATLLAVGMGLATAGHAADTVVFGAAGSSALYPVTEQSAYNTGYTSHFSHAAAGKINDTAQPSGETGAIWIAWKGSAGNYTIAYAVSVDSTVGNRSFFNRDTVTYTGPVDTSGNGTPDGSNPVLKAGPMGTTVVDPDVAVPAEVIAAVNTFAINVGLTDITPSDALVATTRSLGLGYNGTNPIRSSFAGTLATPVAFSTGARPFTLNQLGAVPVVVFVNTSDTGAGGFGSISTTPSTSTSPGTEFRANIDRFTLSGFLSGQLGTTTDLISDVTLQGTVKTVTTIIREPLSGTYNTMEYCIPESQEARGFTGRGQEQGISSATNNGSSGVPASAISGAGGVRRRAIGTGQSVNNANTIANALGYAFWSVNTFKANTNLRYLTVDGADPLFDNYSVTSNEGSLQPATTPTFRNVKNGGYPIWSILRAVTDSSTPSGVTNILNAIPTGDFVPYSQLEVFRSFHGTPDAPSPSNGNLDPTTRAGGDVGGAVFPINADIDFANATGAELVNFRQ